jgi:hypothetical protein
MPASAFWRRVPALYLVLVSLLLGAVDIHGHSHADLEAAEAFSEPHLLIFEEAAHPWAALHVEAAGAGQEVRPCPACLHLRRLACATRQEIPTLALPAPSLLIHAAIGVHWYDEAYLPASPRAPPFI